MQIQRVSDFGGDGERDDADSATPARQPASRDTDGAGQHGATVAVSRQSRAARLPQSARAHTDR